MAGTRLRFLVLGLGIVVVCQPPLLPQTPQGLAKPFTSACSSKAGLAKAGLAGASGTATGTPLPPLPGKADDSNGNISWVAEATETSPDHWQIRHTATNHSTTERVKVKWIPGVLDTWLDPNGDSDGSTVTSMAKPAYQAQGPIEYGKQGTQPAPWYQRVDSPPKSKGPLEASVDIDLTILLNGEYRDVALAVRSRAVPRENGFSVEYCVDLSPAHGSLKKDILIDWQAAASPQLTTTLKRQREDGLMFLPGQGPALHEVQIPTGVVLRSGSLVVRSVNQEALAAAYAPAYGPAR